MFTINRFGIVPDIVVLAKALSGGDAPWCIYFIKRDNVIADFKSATWTYNNFRRASSMLCSRAGIT